MAEFHFPLYQVSLLFLKLSSDINLTVYVACQSYSRGRNGYHRQQQATTFHGRSSDSSSNTLSDDERSRGGPNTTTFSAPHSTRGTQSLLSSSFSPWSTREKVRLDPVLSLTGGGIRCTRILLTIRHCRPSTWYREANMGL